jgi:hypothetical protein
MWLTLVLVKTWVFQEERVLVRSTHIFELVYQKKGFNIVGLRLAFRKFKNLKCLSSVLQQSQNFLVVLCYKIFGLIVALENQDGSMHELKSGVEEYSLTVIELFVLYDHFFGFVVPEKFNQD